MPPLVFQMPLQLAGGEVVGRLATLPAKPLKAGGADPPDRLFAADQVSLHQVTGVEAPAAATVLSPSTNAPRLGKANTVAVLPVSEEAR